jgi:hypothetical protein
VCKKFNGLRQRYEDECEHDYDEDEDAGEFVCMVPGCGDRQPIPLDRLIHE